MIEYYSEDVLRKLLPDVDVKSALTSAFIGLANNTSKQPDKTIIELSGSAGDCMFFTGLVEELNCFGVKVSPFLESRSAEGKNPVTAYTMLVSSVTGLPLAFCDAQYLTTVRTAETTALAIDFLYDKKDGKLAVIGSGEAAQYHLKTQSRDREWNSISMYSPSLLNDKNKQNIIQGLSANVIKFCESSTDAITDADVIMLCTNSADAVIDQESVKEGALITSISTDAKLAREINPSSLTNYDVYCDYRNTIKLKAGEMQIAKEKHGWDHEKIIADLPELLTKKPSINNSNTRFWRSTGLAIEDIAIAYALIK